MENCRRKKDKVWQLPRWHSYKRSSPGKKCKLSIHFTQHHPQFSQSQREKRGKHIQTGKILLLLLDNKSSIDIHDMGFLDWSTLKGWQEPTTFIEAMFPCCTDPTVKKFSLMVKQNVGSCNLYLLILVLVSEAKDNNSWPASQQLPPHIFFFWYLNIAILSPLILLLVRLKTPNSFSQSSLGIFGMSLYHLCCLPLNIINIYLEMLHIHIQYFLVCPFHDRHKKGVKIGYG